MWWGTYMFAEHANEHKEEIKEGFDNHPEYKEMLCESIKTVMQYMVHNSHKRETDIEESLREEPCE